jgi:hypothetical protein
MLPWQRICSLLRRKDLGTANKWKNSPLLHFSATSEAPHKVTVAKQQFTLGIAGRIYQELRNSYNIFLDSEATFNLHNLRLIVKYTGLFVFILSEGIFDSFWCLEGIFRDYCALSA